jgi:hypothetical protein
MLHNQRSEYRHQLMRSDGSGSKQTEQDSHPSYSTHTPLYLFHLAHHTAHTISTHTLSPAHTIPCTHNRLSHTPHTNLVWARATASTEPALNVRITRTLAPITFILRHKWRISTRGVRSGPGESARVASTSHKSWCTPTHGGGEEGGRGRGRAQ